MSAHEHDRYVVTGANGFLGRHLVPLLVDRYGASRVRALCRSDYDLMDPAQVQAMFEVEKPDCLIHLAAYSGGIGINRAAPADFYYRNTLLTALVFEAAARQGVRRLVYTMGGCSYPAQATSPISELQMWDGFPQPDSAGYSCAKKMGLVASTCYREQYGMRSMVLIPGNMYGEYDNFREDESHVVPGMIRRFFEAGRAGAECIRMWGSGRPVRDFVHAGDVARAVVALIERYEGHEPLNISTGRGTSIAELADLIAELTGFEGRIEWDRSRPDGQRVKVFDTTRLRAQGLDCPTPLREGLRRTIAWFSACYDDCSDGLRR